MREFLGTTEYGNKEKASEGTISKILAINGNERIRNAIQNAKKLNEYWNDNDKNITRDIVEMNPSVNIHILIERLLDEIEWSCK